MKRDRFITKSSLQKTRFSVYTSGERAGVDFFPFSLQNCVSAGEYSLLFCWREVRKHAYYVLDTNLYKMVAFFWNNFFPDLHTFSIVSLVMPFYCVTVQALLRGGHAWFWTWLSSSQNWYFSTLLLLVKCIKLPSERAGRVIRQELRPLELSSRHPYLWTLYGTYRVGQVCQ